MKSSEQLKKNLLEEDDNNDLTEEQNKRLNEAIRQANAGEVMNLDEFKRRMSLWHTIIDIKEILK